MAVGTDQCIVHFVAGGWRLVESVSWTAAVGRIEMPMPAQVSSCNEDGFNEKREKKDSWKQEYLYIYTFCLSQGYCWWAVLDAAEA